MRRNFRKIGAVVTLFAMMAMPLTNAAWVAASDETDALENDPDPFVIASDDAQDYDTENLKLTKGLSYTKKDGTEVEVTGAIDTMVFMADPTSIEVDGKLYMYGTLDQRSYADEFDADGKAVGNTNDPENGKVLPNKYQTKKLGIYSTTDLVNWTDEGVIDMEQVLGPDGQPASARWAWNAWAPTAMKYDSDGDGKDEYYIFFTNGGDVGYVKGETPTGPWKDEIGKQLWTVAAHPDNAEGMGSRFDPSVLMDPDTKQAYIYWGGLGDGSDHPKCSRAAKLKIEADKVEVDWDSYTVLDAYYHFEDNEINKFEGKYVYSYCANWNSAIKTDKYISGGSVSINAYISDDPLDIAGDPANPGDSQAQFIGTILDNPGAELFDEWYNNHHHMFQFKGKYYMFYHTTALDQFLYKDFYAPAGKKSMSYRNMHVDELDVDMDGDSPSIKVIPTYEGPAQTDDFNPYQVINATTQSHQGGLTRKILDDGTVVVDKIDTGDWTRIDGVDFGEKAATKLTAKVASETDEARIDVFLDDPASNDNKIATLAVKNTGADNYEELSADLTGVTGKHNVYFVFRGTGYNVASWEFSNGEQGQPQPSEVPGPGPSAQPDASAQPGTPAQPSASVQPVPTASAPTVTVAPDAGKTITLAKPAIKSVKNVKGKKAQVTLKKKVKDAAGYEIQYSLKSNMKSAKKVQIKKASTLKATIKGLKNKKKYYVRARAYATVDGKKQYSAWSAKKTVKIKK